MRRKVWAQRLIAACAVSIAAALTGACGGGEETDLLTVSNGVPISRGVQMSALVDVNGGVVALSSEQIGTTGIAGATGAVVRSLPARGNVVVRIILTKSPTDTIAVGEAPFELTKGFVYTVMSTIQPAGTHQACFGCSGHFKFPLRGSQATSTDSMWVYVSNAPPLCKGCVT